jgi:8-oxo-dGTP pyrophosphatase MutT (NUDIX family)
MITFYTGSVCFNLRLATVILDRDRVLLHHVIRGDFWVLPGGRAEMLEDARAGLTREMHEELGAAVEVGRLLWVVENFFSRLGTPYHELDLIFLAYLPPDCPFSAVKSFWGVERGRPLLFRWFDLAQLDDIAMYPTFLKKALCSLPDATQYLVHRDTTQ